jgi:hypothetical protein
MVIFYINSVIILDFFMLHLQFTILSSLIQLAAAAAVAATASYNVNKSIILMNLIIF